MKKVVIVDLPKDLPLDTIVVSNINGELLSYKEIELPTDDVIDRRAKEKYPRYDLMSGQSVEYNAYKQGQRDLLDVLLIPNNLLPSFRFMRDNHTFVKIEGNDIHEIMDNAFKISKENPYGMVCPVTILNGEKELRRVGNGCHVNKDGYVDLQHWVMDIMEDSVVKSYLNQ